LWGFVQYKNLATDAAGQQSHLGLSWLRSELQRDLGNDTVPPTAASVRNALHRIVAAAPEAPVIYYLDGDAAATVVRALPGRARHAGADRDPLGLAHRARPAPRAQLARSAPRPRLG